jgi:CRISPR/Cas system-associated exonuclease Cas4 (RecB family)
VLSYQSCMRNVAMEKMWGAYCVSDRDVLLRDVVGRRVYGTWAIVTLGAICVDVGDRVVVVRMAVVRFFLRCRSRITILL